MHLGLSLLIALLSGALLPLSLAPFDYWPLAIVSCAGLYALLQISSLQKASPRSFFLNTFFYGLGLFGIGVSWVFVSIYTYGQTPLLLALLMTGLFVSSLAFVFALPWWLAARYIGNKQRYLPLLFTAVWLLVEWLRTWLFTGFPWLFSGYSQLETPLSGWAPIIGVLGIGAIIAYTSTLAIHSYRALREKDFSHINSPIKYSLPLVIFFWGAGAFLQNIQWTQPDDKPLSVSLVQGNVGLFEKWDYRNHPAIVERYFSLTEPLWETSDIILWPENAIPLIRHEAQWILEQLDSQAKSTKTNFQLGILTYDIERQRYYNTMLSLGEGSGHYYKRRLVPFGEYMPLENWLRGLINFFDLPLSIIIPGESKQPLLTSHTLKVASLICYEIAYPDLTARTARDSNYLLTVSNDAWFNDSIAPQQHLQLAQMRALENGRYLIRGTNNGVSAIINPDGSIQSQGPQFTTTVIQGKIQSMTGATPFMSWGSWPVVLLAMIGLMYCYRQRKPALK